VRESEGDASADISVTFCALINVKNDKKVPVPFLSFFPKMVKKYLPPFYLLTNLKFIVN